MILRNLFLFLIYLSSITIISFLLNFGDFLLDFLYQFSNNNETGQTFDYIIVGGGSAGSILANRLSSNKTRQILLLEAGKFGIDTIFHIPAFAVLLQNSPFNWNYETVPQQYSCLALNNRISRWPMGKILGGTSMLNNMLYVRGHKYDFDEWFHNDRTYNYTNILNYFNKIEEFDETIEMSSSKSIYVRDIIFNSILSDVILKAANRLGYQIWQENLNSLIGFNKPKATLYKGKRWTSANLLKINKKSNLIIKTNRIVEKVLLKANYEAYGVRYKYLGQEYTVYAKHGIILSAGVIGTPKILMLSGIGHEEHLKQMNIESKLNLPVGDNLQDHLTTGLDLIGLNRSLDLTIIDQYSLSSFWNYFINGKGPWTTTGCDLMAFFNIGNSSSSSSSSLVRPDLQFMIMPLSLNQDDGLYLRKLLGISDSIWMNYFEQLNNQQSISIMPILLHPKSKGTVRLNRNNPFLQPEIDPKYLTNQYDIDLLVNGIKLIKEFIKTPELSAFGAILNNQHFPGCESYHFDSDAYWHCYVRHLTITSYHPVGTCKMGDPLDRTTVVDYNFQVKQTNKLFIVDGSVLASPSSGNINGAILMIAEMASDLIQANEWLSNGKCSIYEVFIQNVVCCV